MSHPGQIVSTASTVNNIISVLSLIASVALPESATVASIIKVATAVGQSLAQGAPAAQALVDEVTAIKAGGGALTAEQWAAYDAAADAASDDLDAAAAREAKQT